MKHHKFVFQTSTNKTEEIMNWCERERVPLIGSPVNVSTNHDSRNFCISTAFQPPASCLEISTEYFWLAEPMKGKAEKPLHPAWFASQYKAWNKNLFVLFLKGIMPSKYHCYSEMEYLFSFFKNSVFFQVLTQKLKSVSSLTL